MRPKGKRMMLDESDIRTRYGLYRIHNKCHEGQTIYDLVLMCDAGVQIAEADFLEVYRRENTLLDFTFCEFCGAETFQQHLPDCRRESILGDPRWHEILQQDRRAG
jgi:hypothetical protein